LAVGGVDSRPILPGRGVKPRLKGYEEEIAKQLKLHSRNIKKCAASFREGVQY